MQHDTTRPMAVALVMSTALHLSVALVYLHRSQGSTGITQPMQNAESKSPGAMHIRLASALTQSDQPSQTRKTPAAPKAPAKRSTPGPSAQPSTPPPARPTPPVPVETPVPATGPVLPEPERQVAARYDMQSLKALAALNLNAAPRLVEPFTLELASLAPLPVQGDPPVLSERQPMAMAERASLASALRYVETHLAEATDHTAPMHWRDGKQEFTLHLEREPAASATELEHAVLEVHTEVEGVAMTARLPAKRVAFSHYAQVIDRWNPDVSLSSDRILGRFHANSAVHIDADREHRPLVTGASTVSGRVHFAGTARRGSVFPNGLETGVPRMPLPHRVFDWEALAPGEDHVHRLHEDAQILFHGDGSYEWHALGSDSWHTVTPSASPWLLIANEGVELRVEGTVAGSLLVYSPTRVTVSGDLRYAHDPHVGASEDYIGLVSDAYVEVATPEITGPGDLDIQAVVFAGRQFRVRRYRDSHGGLLSIFGSVTAGSLSATEPRYSTLLEFDHRLEEHRPAYFPMTNHYVFENAEPAWVPAVDATAYR